MNKSVFKTAIAVVLLVLLAFLIPSAMLAPSYPLYDGSLLGQNDPLLTIGWLSVTPYSCCMTLGAALAVVLTLLLFRRDSNVDAPALCILAIPCALIGGHLVYCATMLGSILSDYEEGAALIWQLKGGYTLYGALIGLFLGLLVYARAAHRPFARLADAVTPGAALALAIGRLGEIFIAQGLGGACETVKAGETGLFSLDELDELRSTGVELGESPENELWREFMLIYNCVSLPSDTLTIFYPELDESGSATRPSILVKRAGQLFGMNPSYQSAAPAGLSARRPAFRLAAGAKREMPSQDFADAAAAAAEYFSVRAPLELTEVENAVMRLRGSITPENAAALYGKRIKISASGAEKFFSCRFAYFCRYGLKINARRQAVFAGRETGTFTHYVLQHTAEDIKAAGGFSAVDDEFISACAQSRIEEYRKNFLTGAELKSARFLYNFRRTAESILRVVLDMASELRRSDFTPAAFELDFRNAVLPDVSAAQADYDFRITGIADRVDVFQTDGKAYLRIIDYKTGSKEFSLTDIWYGMSMQMLLYLYALCSAPESTRAELSLGRDCEILPAGVMYMPAKAKYINVDPDDDEAEVAAKRAAELKRTGLILNEGGVPEAWAKTEGDDSQENLYSFLKKDKNGSYNSNYAITRGQFEQLYAHMTARLREMAEELQKGAISAGPFVKSSKSPCDVCDYSRVCMFREGENGEHSRVAEKMAPDEIWQKLAEEVDHNG